MNQLTVVATGHITTRVGVGSSTTNVADNPTYNLPFAVTPGRLPLARTARAHTQANHPTRHHICVAATTPSCRTLPCRASSCHASPLPSSIATPLLYRYPFMLVTGDNRSLQKRSWLIRHCLLERYQIVRYAHSCRQSDISALIHAHSSIQHLITATLHYYRASSPRNPSSRRIIAFSLELR